MKSSKRDFLKSAAVGLALYASAESAQSQTTSKGKYRRISCEEACSFPEVTAELTRRANGIPTMSSGPIKGPFMPNLLDVGAGRIRGMDEDGVDVQLLQLVSPGVQSFDVGTALSMAKLVNDRLADTVKQYPTRYAALATIAPQAPAETAKELERAVRTLGLKGGIIDSHTNNEYLDDQKFWPIFEAAQALDVPIYLHPREPSAGLAGPLAVPGFTIGWGYSVETGTHAIRLIGAGVFDQFPKLRIVLGHLGETLPFLLDRLDNRYLWQTNLFGQKALPRLPSEYFRDHFVITTSGMNYDAPVRAALEAMGPDKVLFAADYPLEVQKDAVVEMEGIKLPADLKKKIFETNAARVFKL
jgi:5-carboxyvanillate decarboxylase